jgi:hypothetical protein
MNNPFDDTSRTIRHLLGPTRDGEYLSRYSGKNGVATIEPCNVAGQGGYAQWFRIVYDDGHDEFINAAEVESVTRDAPAKEPDDGR